MSVSTSPTGHYSSPLLMKVEGLLFRGMRKGARARGRYSASRAGACSEDSEVFCLQLKTNMGGVYAANRS